MLKPSGTLALSWDDLTVWEDDGPDAAHDAAAHDADGAFHGPSATEGWAQAQDAAERLYMVGTFYRYSADWGRVAAEEVLSERGASAKVRLRPGG